MINIWCFSLYILLKGYDWVSSLSAYTRPFLKGLEAQVKESCDTVSRNWRNKFFTARQSDGTPQWPPYLNLASSLPYSFLPYSAHTPLLITPAIPKYPKFLAPLLSILLDQENTPTLSDFK
jgi:hypothetical protein